MPSPSAVFFGAMLARALLLRRGAARALSTMVNPMGVALPASEASVDTGKKTAIAYFKNLPVSPKKLRIVANLTPRLYWREAMLQLEFCRKNMAVMVKNCIESAAGNAENEGLDKNRLIVGVFGSAHASHCRSGVRALPCRTPPDPRLPPPPPHTPRAQMRSSSARGSTSRRPT